MTCTEYAPDQVSHGPVFPVHVAQAEPVAHVAQVFHVDPVAQVSHVNPVAHVFHVAPVAHVFHVAQVEPCQLVKYTYPELFKVKTYCPLYGQVIPR